MRVVTSNTGTGNRRHYEEEDAAVFCRESEDNMLTTKSTVISLPKCGPTLDYSSTENWIQTSSTLRDNPVLMTSRVLILALQNQPPAHVIRFMLSVNPRAGNCIPKEGPTPLQVAVQHNASLEVIKILLQACPFSLCVTNPPHAEDPLSYAKRHRKNDKELIELLSQPLSYWIEERSRDPNASVTSYPEDRTPPPAPPVDVQELYNVKLLCAKLLKNHKKMVKQLTAYEEELKVAKVDKSEILQELQDQQQKHFYRQLIALDMKERAMRAHINKVESRCMGKVEEKLKGWQKGLESWKSTTEAKMNEWQVLLDHEIKINTHFRNDLGQWMEEQIREETPFMFATPLGELDDEVPLCPKDHEMELVHVKKQAWKPFSRHWDRIMLSDEEEEV